MERVMVIVVEVWRACTIAHGRLWLLAASLSKFSVCLASALELLAPDKRARFFAAVAGVGAHSSCNAGVGYGCNDAQNNRMPWRPPRGSGCPTLVGVWSLL